ncbi:MAG: hypothetical protein OXH96_21240 [Spirochaetaceae bacterium]|nr:hypothetical protein [Spirochaetaceae bacterium]
MRHLPRFLIACGVVLLAIGCTGGRQPMPALAPVVLGEDTRQTDAFQLNAAAVDGDVLAIEVSYAGGCRNHEFLLRASRSFQVVSGSVRLEIALIHNANEDPCEAFLTEQFRFDLDPVKRLYRQTYSQETGTVYLRLDGHAGPLVYRF